MEVGAPAGLIPLHPPDGADGKGFAAMAYVSHQLNLQSQSGTLPMSPVARDHRRRDGN
jgi:hypothetical protein